MRSSSRFPSAAGKAKSYETWNKEFGRMAVSNAKTRIVQESERQRSCPTRESQRETSASGCNNRAREQRDKGVESLRRKYAPKIAALQERVRRAEQQKRKAADRVPVQSDAGGHFRRRIDPRGIPGPEDDQRDQHRPGYDCHPRGRTRPQGVTGCESWRKRMSRRYSSNWPTSKRSSRRRARRSRGDRSVE